MSKRTSRCNPARQLRFVVFGVRPPTPEPRSRLDLLFPLYPAMARKPDECVHDQWAVLIEAYGQTPRLISLWLVRGRARAQLT